MTRAIRRGNDEYLKLVMKGECVRNDVKLSVVEKSYGVGLSVHVREPYVWTPESGSGECVRNDVKLVVVEKPKIDARRQWRMAGDR